MGVKRLVRVNELLKQEVAAALYRVMNERGFDLSAVTITRVMTSSDLHSARVFVSIRDHRQERGHILAQLGHHAGDIQYLLNKNVALKYTPKLTFELDESIELGDRVLQIIHRMEETQAPAQEPVAGEAEDAAGGESTDEDDEA
ncbi:MAG: 30S ribosome-binding factor RbfA [Verrucomicrobiota bacterium]